MIADTIATLERRVTHASRWLVPLTPSDGEVRLFCFPYAGGGPHTFSNWRTAFPPWVGVYSVQLPGRGRRLAEPLLDRLELLVAPIAAAIRAMDDRPYVLFGHSMGALLAFETARALRTMGFAEPARLIVSAYGAPPIPLQRPAIHQLSHDAFVSHIRGMGGTPADVFRHPELLDLIVPILRADFAAIENYVYRLAAKFRAPITAFAGKCDSFVPLDSIRAWCEQTDTAFDLRVFEGDHFFLHGAERDLLRSMTTLLTATRATLDTIGYEG
jgi:medium-chain acyl-[acyl-carrier-protein] hydrolase